jgi:hypothetical protein
MSKRYSIQFTTSEEDMRLLLASLNALQSEVLSARFGHKAEFDDAEGKWTLAWWRLPTGGFDAK